MTPQHVAILERLVTQAQGADMDIGMSVNVLAALLKERAALVEALKEQVELWEMAKPILDLAQHKVKFTELHNPIGLLNAALAQAGVSDD